ncbi:hypothetical protein BX600DRAFT_432413 [Xylariales sp. PMI_506]|nr:hypothetical protein BX600DRAFT_432413 [Xylariales sp. PMI_506]
MALARSWWSAWRAAALAVAFATVVRGDNILTTSSFSNCDNTTGTVTVQKVNISYNQDNKTVTFDVAGTSSEVQNVTATLSVTAYGENVYSNSFNPCDDSTFVKQLCPVPAGSFAASGTQAIPASYASLIPAIAFEIPDIAANAQLQLKTLNGTSVGCIQSTVSNGKTASVPAVSYIMAGVAGIALVASGVSAIGAAAAGGAGGGGGGAMSPSFTEVIGVFQGFALNAMHSVNYPSVYRSFAKNFAFSTGLIPWTAMQETIDSFRNMTGGNLTNNSFDFLQNATLVYPDGSSATPSKSILKRTTLDFAALMIRDIETSVNSTSTSSDNATTTESTFQTTVSGIEAYVEMLSVPQANTYMTVLLVVAILIAVIIVGILLLKLILEAWALFGNFPKSLTGFRKHYWGSIARSITHLILLLYGVWVLISLYQFTKGDSWAAKTLAGVTLALFTGILGFFTYKIWSTAKKLKAAEGDASALYEDKKFWVKYSLFYESYKRDYWWTFVPVIVYLLAKGCILALGDGYGMAQTIAQLVLEALMLVLLIWSRPYERKSGNVVNILIQVIRVLSVACILVFVEEFAIAETTQTVAGVVLIAIQSALAGILALLIAWNAIVSLCKKNPHRQRRKEMEKMQMRDTLTPLDARNSLLLERVKTDNESTTFSIADNYHESKQPLARGVSPSPAEQRQQQPYRGPTPQPGNPYAVATYNRPLTPSGPYRDDQRLIGGAAPMAREPTLPNVGGGGYGMGGGYGGRPGGGGYSSLQPPSMRQY